MGQQALQALVSRSTNASGGSAPVSHPPSSTPRSAAGIPLRRPGGEGQMDLQEACQRIEQRDAPEDIFGAVLETAAQSYGEDGDIEVMLEELASDPELADEYMKLLLEQVGERVESESEAKNQS